MHPKLKSSSQKTDHRGGVFVVAAIYLGVTAAVLEAGWFADHPDSGGLRLAPLLDPSNAE
jgi:hypothetical protein